MYIFFDKSLLHNVDWLLTKCVSPLIVDSDKALDYKDGLHKMLQL